MKTASSHVAVMALLTLLNGCSKNEDTATLPAGAPVVEVTGYMTPFEETTTPTRGTYEPQIAQIAQAPKRAWQPPTGFGPYSDPDRSISAFFTQTAGEPEGGFQEEYFFKGSSGKWRVSKTDLAAETYYLYGYVPHETYLDSKVEAPEGKTFEDGAVLTIGNLNTISDADVCVVVGAKNGIDDYREAADYTVTGLTRGTFDYAARTTGESGTGGNRVYLLFDHLYAGLNFRIRLDGDYAKLRKIRLKELHLQMGNESGLTKKKTTATVTLNRTSDGTDPISSITFAPTAGSDDEAADGLMFKSETGQLLQTSFDSTYSCYIMPQGITLLKLTSVYDVYDRYDNLTRENFKTTNNFLVSDLLSGVGEAERGKRLTINLTVQPTFLYMLSEQDLDSPTMILE